MVFGLFSRKSQPAPPNPTQPESSGTPPPPPPPPRQSQLRTPSPSIGSPCIDKPTSPSSPPPPSTPSPPPELPVDPSELHALVHSVPPKTLHSYTLAHLSPATPPATLVHLAAFFAALTPPPSLHCIRCHKPFFDVENTDHSCLVSHDDDSAEVERVGISRGGAAEYETLWACCGRTVEGDGDMGPPDGWCYEGKHTTDPKRARFRADSTLHDDKLTSCSQLGCLNAPTAPRPMRKRSRPVEDDDDKTNDTASYTSISHSSEPSIGKRLSKKARTGAKGRMGQVVRREAEEEDPQVSAAPAEDRMEIDKAPTHPPPPTTPPSPRSKPKLKPKPSSHAAPTSTTHSPSALPARAPESAPETPCAKTHKMVVEMRPRSALGSPQLKPQSSAAASGPKSCLKPVSSAASHRPRTADTSARAAKPKSSARVRIDADVRPPSPGKGRGRGRAKSLVEVVETSVDGERE